MELIRVAKHVKFTELGTVDITPLQTNIMVALLTRGGQLSITDLIACVRKSNSGYKFVEDKQYYKAVAILHQKMLVNYG